MKRVHVLFAIVCWATCACSTVTALAQIEWVGQGPLKNVHLVADDTLKFVGEKSNGIVGEGLDSVNVVSEQIVLKYERDCQSTFYAVRDSLQKALGVGQERIVALGDSVKRKVDLGKMQELRQFVQARSDSIDERLSKLGKDVGEKADKKLSTISGTDDVRGSLSEKLNAPEQDSKILPVDYSMLSAPKV